MIHRFIIPGIIAGALHGGVFLIPNPPAPPPPRAEKPVEVVSLGEIPKVPVIPDTDPNAARGDRDNNVGPPVPLLDPIPVMHIEPGVFADQWMPSLPHPDFDSSAMKVGPGDFVNRDGIEQSEGFRGLFREVDLDKQPRTVFQAAPDYPSAAKNTGLSGTVTVVFRVDENGGVHDARVVDSSDRVFNDAALRAVSRWRFEPGSVHGRRVAFMMSVPIAFNLSEGE